MSLARYIEQTNKHTSFTLGACSALFGIFYLYLFSGESLFKPDSLGYVDFSPIRSVGYPLFLKSVFFLWGSYTIIPFIQLFLFCCSAYFLSVSFFQISRSFPLSFLLLCALLGNVPFAQFSFFILTESITQSLLMLALALTIRAWNSPNKAYYGLCFVVGIATIVRPLFIVLAVLPFGLLFLQSSLKKLFSKPFFIGAFIIMFILSLGSAMQFFRYGFFKTESFLGYNLIGKVLLATPANAQKNFFPTAQKNVLLVQPILEKAPSLHLRYLISEPYYDIMRSLVAQETSISSTTGRDDLWKNLSIAYIRDNPQEYARDVWMNYCALWQLWDLYTYEEGKAFYSYLKAHSPLPLIGTGYRVASIRDSLNKKLGYPLVVYSVRAFLILGFILSLCMPFLGLVYKLNKKPISIFLACGALSAAVLQSGFIGIACTQAGLGRYALSLWPCLCILFFSAVTLIGRKYK